MFHLEPKRGSGLTHAMPLRLPVAGACNGPDQPAHAEKFESAIGSRSHMVMRIILVRLEPRPTLVILNSSSGSLLLASVLAYVIECEIGFIYLTAYSAFTA